jgi:hypothetical protein
MEAMTYKSLNVAVGLAGAAAALFALPSALADLAAVEPPVPVALEASADERKLLVEACEKAVAEKDDTLFANALHDMESRRHDDFVPWVRRGLGSADATVLSMALRAAASHELRDVEKDVRKILRTKPKGKRAQGDAPAVVAAAAVDYLARLDFKGEEQRVFEDYLAPLYLDTGRMQSAWARDTLRAACHYLGNGKYKKAVPFLVDQLPEPYPTNPSDPNNPPESYWKARWELWKAGEGWVRWALREITGEEFRTHREWTVWLDRNKKDYR